jgi:hypothetical protein
MFGVRARIMLPVVLGMTLGFMALQMGTGRASAQSAAMTATSPLSYPVTTCRYGFYATGYRCPVAYVTVAPTFWSYYRWPAYVQPSVFYGYSPTFSNGYWWWWNGGSWWWSQGSGHQWYPWN